MPRRENAVTLRGVVSKHFWQTALLGLALATSSCQRNSGPPQISGTIEADEVHVASRYGGRVIRLSAREGDMLTPGQLLVELDAAELAARREQAAAVLAEMVAGSRPEEIQAAQQDWQARQADLDYARAEKQRAMDLHARKTISDAEFDRATLQAQGLEQSAAAARSRYDLLRAGTRPERVALARAQLAELDAQVREMKIYAPTNSVLEVLGVKVGDVLGPNREVATLVLPQNLWVRVYVPETWLAAIQPGDVVRVRVDGFPGRDFPGTVEQVNRSAEFTPRNVQTVEERIKQVFGVKVRLADAAGHLRAGLSADVSFPKITP